MTYINYMCIKIFLTANLFFIIIFKYLHKMMIAIVALIHSYSIVDGIKMNYCG